ncbi:MAG: YggS family pyridoxal phosphate-dependent enzyme [Pseudomonadota bacterium]
MTDPATCIADVRSAIDRAASTADRDPASITLIAISKTFGPDRIKPVIDAGHRHFGENRVQESLAKWPDLKSEASDLTLHLVGPLQSNKAREAVALFDVIHSVDRPKIARALKDEMDRQGRKLDLFVQINTGEEPQKAGIVPAEADAFLDTCRLDLGLGLKGLMCIPPVDDHPAPHFALLAKIAARNGLSGLSMGMSADYEEAIMLGATHVRVGSAIFGARTAKPA